MRKYFKLKSLIVYSILFFINSSINSQSGWVVQQNNVNFFPWTIYAVNENVCWTGGKANSSLEYGVIMKTINGGVNWNFQYTDTTSFYFSSLFFSDQNSGIAVGAPNSVLRTINGGINWNSQINNTHFYLPHLSFINQLTGWCATDTINSHGIILKTEDGGQNWTYQNSGTTRTLNNICFINQNTGWCIGDIGATGGFVIKTTNGGIDWNSVYTDSVHTDFRIVNFVDSLTGWILCDNMYHWGRILKSTNGGVNWVLVYNAENIYLLVTMCFVNQELGWLGGISYNSNLSNLILKTTNGGFSWIEQYNAGEMEQGIRSISFINQFTGWAAAAPGLILKTTNGGEPIGIIPISNNIPDKFSLSQNYPNPFNPSTKIKFSLPEVRGEKLEVRLGIYDILGRQIASLIPPLRGGEEGLAPGTYEVEWDGSNYSSGVYFYKLETQSFSETRKMVLLK